MKVESYFLKAWNVRLRLRLRERLGFELGGRRPSFAKAWPPKTYPRQSAPVAPRWIGIPLPRGASEGCQVEGGRSKKLSSSLGGAGSMTPLATEVGPLGVQRGGLRRGRPTMAKEDRGEGELSFFMQKEVRLSRFQSWSYAGGHSC